MNRRFRRGWDRLDQAIYRSIEARWVDASEQNDALGAVLLVEDDEEGGGGMTDRQIRDEALTLILAGHEMTAVALTWALYLLARHPEVEAELKRVLNGRTPTAHDILDLQYTRMVLAESMRLYPPENMIGRQALADFRSINT
jgi:cytochrome P450